jgi:hypothetical protein
LLWKMESCISYISWSCIIAPWHWCISQVKRVHRFAALAPFTSQVNMFIPSHRSLHKANVFMFLSMQRPSPTVSVQAHNADHGAGQTSQWHGYILPLKVSQCVSRSNAELNVLTYYCLPATMGYVSRKVVHVWQSF